MDKSLRKIKTYYLGCLIKSPKLNENRSFEFLEKSILFFIENVRPSYEGITIKLLNFTPSEQNMTFFDKLILLVNEENVKYHNIFLHVSLDSYKISNSIRERLSQNQICWDTSFSLEKINAKQLSGYYSIKNLSDYNNKGVTVTYDPDNSSYYEIFNKLYQIAYGYPITLKSLNKSFYRKNTKDFIKDFSSFLSILYNQLMNYEFGMADSFLAGNNYLGNVIKTVLHNNEKVFRDSDYEYSPCLDSSRNIYYNSRMASERFLVGSISKGIDQEKVDSIISELTNNKTICPYCPINSICPKLECKNNFIELHRKCNSMAIDFVKNIQAQNKTVFEYLKYK